MYLSPMYLSKDAGCAGHIGDREGLESCGGWVAGWLRFFFQFLAFSLLSFCHFCLFETTTRGVGCPRRRHGVVQQEFVRSPPGSAPQINYPGRGKYEAICSSTCSATCSTKHSEKDHHSLRRGSVHHRTLGQPGQRRFNHAEWCKWPKRVPR